MDRICYNGTLPYRRSTLFAETNAMSTQIVRHSTITGIFIVLPHPVLLCCCCVDDTIATAAAAAADASIDYLILMNVCWLCMAGGCMHARVCSKKKK